VRLDPDVAVPGGAAVALQRALVDLLARRVRGVVVDERAVLEVLALVGEVDAEQLGLPPSPTSCTSGVR
jgi:hypothetical protein